MQDQAMERRKCALACRARPVEVAGLGVTDWQRIQDLVSTYADLRPGGTDASVNALAERRGALTIATLNRRHFVVARPGMAAGIPGVPFRLNVASGDLPAEVKMEMVPGDP